ncbi:hypothetical protein Tco_1210946 [Tanacetum coccineum]
MSPKQSSSRIVPNTILNKPCKSTDKDDWDCLFQPMFDEYINPPTIIVSLVPTTTEPRAVDIAESPMSTSIDLDAPFTKSLKTPHYHDDPLHESFHEDSTSQGSSSNVRPYHTPFEHLGRYTKEHPIVNVIGDPSRSDSIRKQLKTDTMWCYFDAFLTLVEPKNFKQAMTEPSWIDAMQDEIHEFKRLQNREPISEDILGATIQRDTGSYYPKRYWELLPKEILGAITQRDTRSYTPKRYYELLPKEILGAITQRETGISYGKMEVEGDGEVRVMTRGFGDLVAKLGDKVVMEVLVRCWSDGDVVVRSW